MFYHVIISIKGALDALVRLDLREKQLEDMILTPYHNGTDMVVQGKTIPLEEITEFKITRTSKSSANIVEDRDIIQSINLKANPYFSERRRIAESGEDVTHEFISISPGTNAVIQDNMEVKSNVDKRKVFVVHGRDERLRKSMFDFLTAIRLDPIEWPEAISSTGEGSPYVGKALKILNIAQAIVVLLTPDDMVQLREQLWMDNEPEFEKQFSGQPRPNVLIELGMALAINERATIIVQVGQIKDISDIKGRHILHLDNSAAMKNQLANRLKDAGCEVKTVGNDWLEAGDFEAPVIDIITKSETPNTDFEPDEDATEILVELSRNRKDGRTIEELESITLLRSQKIELILEHLEKHDYVKCNRQDYDRWEAYWLLHRGRVFLNSKELL